MKTIIFLAILVFSYVSASADTSITVLVVGQSNPAGRATMVKQDMRLIDGVFLLHNNRFVKARNPLNQYSTIKKEEVFQKASFVGELLGLMAENRTVYAIVQARGGSDIDCWSRGGYCYDETIDLINRNNIRVDVVIMHQGESNVRDNNYPYRLANMIGDLREDIGVDCPVIIGEVAQSSRAAVAHNRRLWKVRDIVDNIGIVDSDGLNTVGPWHFDRESCQVLGQRYYDKFMEIY